MTDIRLRPREFVEVQASELLPHPLNPRTHPPAQQQALSDSLEQFGDVRSLLAYRSPSRWPGKLVLIDGHLRQSLDDGRPVKVEVLTDLDDAEAEALLLTIDPLAQLASYDEEKLAALRQRAHSDKDTLQALWDSLAASGEAVDNALRRAKKRPEGQGEVLPEKFLLLIECDNEAEQVRLLRRFKREGLVCQAKTS